MTEKYSYPLGIGSDWSSPENLTIPDPLLRNWLTDTGSLTERLQSNCRQFKVDVLFQGTADISDEEAQTLYGQFGDQPRATQVREVLLNADDSNWVFARSLMPMDFLQTAMRELSDLGTKPLGKIIFNDDRFVRQRIEITRIHSESLPQHWFHSSNHDLWGRRSLFRFQQFYILVAEVFLPGSPAYSRLQPET